LKFLPPALERDPMRLAQFHTEVRLARQVAHKNVCRMYQTESAITPPTAIVHDLDPAIERTLLRTLERDPALRPRSVLAIAAGLPGGDPLAAALAAGETPSPEMVAAAGEVAGLAPGRAFVAFAIVVGGSSGARHSWSGTRCWAGRPS
jgi:hypothetical protein